MRIFRATFIILIFFTCSTICVKNLRLYVMYPDSVTYNKSLSNFQNIKIHLKTIYNMGFNSLHILPFLESGNKDRGFDIIDYSKIDNKYGTEEELKDVVKTAKNIYDIDVFMDMVFNHISSEHELFKKAVSGSSFHKNFFFTKETEPIYLKNISSKFIAVYNESSSIKYIELFNLIHDKIPNWTLYNNTWYFHTFFKDQIDLNWNNPEIFSIFKPIIQKWLEFGFNFRLDAYTFLRGNPYINITSYKNIEITEKMSNFIRKIKPDVIIIGEVAISHEEYFSTNNLDYSYNLTFYPVLYSSVIRENKTFVENYIKDKNTTDINLYYVKCHDEVAMFTADVKNYDYKTCNFKNNYMPPPPINNNVFNNRTFLPYTIYTLTCKNRDMFNLLFAFALSNFKNVLLFSGDEFLVEPLKLSDLNPQEQLDIRNLLRGRFSYYETENNVESFFTKLFRVPKIISEFENKDFKIIEGFPEYISVLRFISDKNPNLFLYKIYNFSKTKSYVITEFKNNSTQLIQGEAYLNLTHNQEFVLKPYQYINVLLN